MKEKSDEKIIPKETLASEAELRRRFPTAAKQLEGKTTSDAFKEMLARVVDKNPYCEKALMGVFSGMPGIDFDVPEWAKRASRKAIEGLGLNCISGAIADADIVTLFAAVGKIFGFAEASLAKPSSSKAIEQYKRKILVPCVGEMKQAASDGTAEQSAAFFNARLKGKDARERAFPIPTRTKVYFFISLNWQEIPKFGSTGKLHEVITSFRTPDGKKLISSDFDSRETRKMCKEIGLEFQNQWRKPKSKI